MEISKRKQITMWVLGSMLAGIAGCSTLTPYSLGYVSRVVIKQASDFDDYKWRNTIRVAAPKTRLRPHKGASSRTGPRSF